MDAAGGWTPVPAAADGMVGQQTMGPLVLVRARRSGDANEIGAPILPTDFAASVPDPCLGDIDADGLIGAADLIALLLAWGPNPGHPADLNGDDVVDFGDLLIVLTGWGPCFG